MMNKTFGVCFGLLALGLVGLGAPASHAKNRLVAGEESSGSEPATTSATSTPEASNPADLRKRIDALKGELADLNKELDAEKDGDSATSAAAPQDQGAPPAAAPAAAAAAPMPLPTPSMSGPLATGIAHELPAGPFGKIEITGALTGIGLFGNNPQTFLGDGEGHVDVSNAQIFIQKTSGVFQFFLQGGAYNLPVVGVPFLKTGLTTTATYGPFPVGYAKIGKG